MTIDHDVIALTANEVRDINADALRARCAAMPFPCVNNLEAALEWLSARPTTGAVRIRLAHATIEPFKESQRS